MCSSFSIFLLFLLNLHPRYYGLASCLGQDQRSLSLMYRSLILVLIFSLFGRLYSQTEASSVFNHVEVAVLAGTAGVGFDVALSVNEQFRVRAGFSYLPNFKLPLDLGIALEDGYEDIPHDQLGDQYRKFNQMLSMLTDLTGVEADNVVNMHIIPTIYNGKFLVDWFPFHDKTWHFSAGLYVGPSQIGKAYSLDSETAFLLALNGYNNIYENVKNEEDIIHVGDAGFEFTPSTNQKILDYGRATFYIGPKKDGTYYHTVPTIDGRVYANSYTNPIRPYLGFGYGKSLGHSGHCFLSFEGGCMMWGGTPTIITHDGVDLAHDMVYIKREFLRNLVNSVSAMKVYPVLEARLAWRIF